MIVFTVMRSINNERLNKWRINKIYEAKTFLRSKNAFKLRDNSPPFNLLRHSGYYTCHVLLILKTLMLQAGRSRIRFPMRLTGLFNITNASSRNMALGSTQPLTEMSTRNLPGGKGRPAHKAENLTVICEPIVWKMWEPRSLTTPWASTACYRDRFTFYSDLWQWSVFIL
jgi:hypothetical protein